jgi:hypothetical protein
MLIVLIVLIVLMVLMVLIVRSDIADNNFSMRLRNFLLTVLVISSQQHWHRRRDRVMRLPTLYQFLLLFYLQ